MATPMTAVQAHQAIAKAQGTQYPISPAQVLWAMAADRYRLTTQA